jgi:hypothetical protein
MRWLNQLAPTFNPPIYNTDTRHLAFAFAFTFAFTFAFAFAFALAAFTPWLSSSIYVVLPLISFILPRFN